MVKVHELPFIRLKNEANFKENMVIADEPGIYLPVKKRNNKTGNY